METITYTKPRVLLIFIFSAVLFPIAYSQSNFQYDCVSIGDDGYLTIKIWNIQKGKNYRFDQARKDAIYAILFSGVPSNNGCISQKPILQKIEEREKFKNIEKEFFSSNGVWATFTRSSDTQTAMSENLGKKECRVFQISVSKNLLRKYLEEKNIIKTLNTGF